MIIDRLANRLRLFQLSPRLARALDYLRATDLRAVTLGRHEIDGDRLFALVQEYTTRAAISVSGKRTGRYVDVQFVVTGVERMGYANIAEMREREAYDAARDVAFFEPGERVRHDPRRHVRDFRPRGCPLALATRPVRRPRCARSSSRPDCSDEDVGELDGAAIVPEGDPARSASPGTATFLKTVLPSIASVRRPPRFVTSARRHRRPSVSGSARAPARSRVTRLVGQLDAGEPDRERSNRVDRVVHPAPVGDRLRRRRRISPSRDPSRLPRSGRRRRSPNPSTTQCPSCPLGYCQPLKSDAGVDRDEPFVGLRDLLGRQRAGRGQLLQPQVAIEHPAAFGLEVDVALPRRDVVPARHLLAVDRELQRAVAAR